MSDYLYVGNYLCNLVIGLIISVTIPNLVIVLLFRKTDNYKYFVGIMKNIKGKLLGER